MATPRNVLGGPLVPCSMDPITGYFRDGTCHCGADDPGVHAVCIRATAEFLAYSSAAGNDLATPRPEFGFPGVKPGDRWCICAGRWLDAFRAGKAPQVHLASTGIEALGVVRIEDLKQYAVDAPERN